MAGVVLDQIAVAVTYWLSPGHEIWAVKSDRRRDNVLTMRSDMVLNPDTDSLEAAGLLPEGAALLPGKHRAFCLKDSWCCHSGRSLLKNPRAPRIAIRPTCSR